MLFETHRSAQIHREDTRVMLHPVVVQRHPVFVTEDELTGIIHQVRFCLLTLVHHDIIHRQHLTAVHHIDTQRQPLVVIIDRGLEGVFVAVFQILGVIGLVLHLQRIGIGLLLLDTFRVIQILRLREGITDRVTQPHLFLNIYLTCCTNLCAIDTCMVDVHELRTDTDTGIAQRFGGLNIVDHLLSLADDVVHRVDHREIGVFKQTELILNHISILCIEGCYVQRTGNRAELIQLLVTDLGIEARLRLDIMIRINTYAADILTGEFLRDRRVTIALTEASAKESRLVNLPVQTGAEHRTNRAEPFADLDIRLFVMVVHTVVLQTHSCAQRQLVGDTVVVLQVRRYIIRMVCTGDIGCIRDMIPVHTGRQTHAGVPLFGKLIIQIAVVRQLRSGRVIVRQQIHRISYCILQLCYRSRIT